MIGVIDTETAIEQVAAAIRTIRVGRVDLEADMYPLIDAALRRAGIWVDREVRLGRRSRVDFLTHHTRIAIEAKKGKPNSRKVLEQLERYAKYVGVQGVVLVVERCVFVPPATVLGKPCRYIGLHKLHGVAL